MPSLQACFLGEETSFATTMFLSAKKCCQKEDGLCLQNTIPDKIMGVFKVSHPLCVS